MEDNNKNFFKATLIKSFWKNIKKISFRENKQEAKINDFEI